MQIHTKKRNRLEHKRLNDLVYVQYNRKMAARFQKRCEKGSSSFDPLCLEEFDWNNEWVDLDAEPIYNGHGLDGITWQQVDDVVGASTMLQGRNFPRRGRGDGCGHESHDFSITYARKRHAVSSSCTSVRLHEEEEVEDLELRNEEDGEEDEDYAVDDEQVDDYGEVAHIVAQDSGDQAGGDGGSSDAFTMDDDYY